MVYLFNDAAPAADFIMPHRVIKRLVSEKRDVALPHLVTTHCATKTEETTRTTTTVSILQAELRVENLSNMRHERDH